MSFAGYDHWKTTEPDPCSYEERPVSEYEPGDDELANCPNCGEVVLRELIFRDLEPCYYWPCQECGFTAHGKECQ